MSTTESDDGMAVSVQDGKLYVETPFGRAEIIPDGMDGRADERLVDAEWSDMGPEEQAQLAWEHVDIAVTLWATGEI